MKISGHRVSLSEVDRAGIERLHAYVVAESGEPAEPASLRRALRTLVPDAMVPARIEVVPDLPLLPSGKVDRRALDGG